MYKSSGQRVNLGNETVRDEKPLWSWRKSTELREGAMGLGLTSLTKLTLWLRFFSSDRRQAEDMGTRPTGSWSVSAARKIGVFPHVQVLAFCVDSVQGLVLLRDSFCLSCFIVYMRPS